LFDIVCFTCYISSQISNLRNTFHLGKSTFIYTRFSRNSQPMLSISSENFAAIRILVSRSPHSSYFPSTTLSLTPATSNSSVTSSGYFHSVLERSFSARSTSLTPRGRTSPHRCLSSRVTLESRVKFSFLLRPKVRIHSWRDRNLFFSNALPSESNMIYIQKSAFGRCYKISNDGCHSP